jgi:hypothetical protein
LPSTAAMPVTTANAIRLRPVDALTAQPASALVLPARRNCRYRYAEDATGPAAAGPSHRCAVLGGRGIRDVDGGHCCVSLGPASTPTTPGIVRLSFG